jgi:hypothetical protein
MILTLWFLPRIISSSGQYVNYKYTVLHPGVDSSFSIHSFVPAHFFASSTSYVDFGIDNLAEFAKICKSP